MIIMRPVTTTPGSLTHVQATRLADALTVPDGGFTVTRDGHDVTSGYALSTSPDHERTYAGTVSAADVLAYATEHAAALSAPGAVFGGWRDPDTGVAYLDVSIVVSDRDEALTLARVHDQLAVFDLDHGESVPA
jgi:hypothetical protein